MRTFNCFIRSSKFCLSSILTFLSILKISSHFKLINVEYELIAKELMRLSPGVHPTHAYGDDPDLCLSISPKGEFSSFLNFSWQVPVYDSFPAMKPKKPATVERNGVEKNHLILMVRIYLDSNR